jgi:hypothetical protein
MKGFDVTEIVIIHTNKTVRWKILQILERNITQSSDETVVGMTEVYFKSSPSNMTTKRIRKA